MVKELVRFVGESLEGRDRDDGPERRGSKESRM